METRETPVVLLDRDFFYWYLTMSLKHYKETDKSSEWLAEIIPDHMHGNRWLSESDSE